MNKIAFILQFFAVIPTSNSYCQAITTKDLRGVWRNEDSDSLAFNFLDSNTLFTRRIWLHKNRIFNYTLQERNNKTYIDINSKDSLDKICLIIKKKQDDVIQFLPNDFPDSSKLNYKPKDSDRIYLSPIEFMWAGTFKKFMSEITTKDLIGVWYYVRVDKIKKVIFTDSTIISEKHKSYSYSLDEPKASRDSGQFLMLISNEINVRTPEDAYMYFYTIKKINYDKIHLREIKKTKNDRIPIGDSSDMILYRRTNNLFD